jgi:two-component system KDP operon response regulator KdpE
MTTTLLREFEPRVAAVPVDLASIRGRRILYVDDDAFVRHASGRLLQTAGAICLLAGTHEQAVAIAAGEPRLELAILDFHMPCGDVGHLVTRLRSTHATIPLIGTSGLDRRAEFAERGVSEFLGKPWKLDALLHAANW